MRYEGEQRRRALITNYAAALNAHNVEFMLVFSLGDVIGCDQEGPGSRCTGRITRYPMLSAGPWSASPSDMCRG